MNNDLNSRGLFGSASAGAFMVAATIRRGVPVVVFGAVDVADDSAAVHAEAV
jgi:hypothetical protein